MLYLLITIVILFISYYFFSMASGTMKLREINASSFVFYYQLLLYSVIGSVIIVNNLDHSLWFRHINLTQEVRIYGWLAILYVIIMLPIGMILANKTLGVNNMYRFFRQYREKKIQPFLSNQDSYIFFGLFFISILSIFGVLYTFFVIGKVPFFEIFKASSAWDLARLRMEVKTEFAGNTYIRQVFGLMLTPLLSYVYYLYYKLYRKKRFYFLFLIFAFLSFLILTYNFEKAPLLKYILGFMFISVLINGRLSKKFFYGLITFVVGLVVLMYVFIMDKELIQLVNLYEGGILQRVLISQIVGVFISFSIFPDIEPFIGLSGLGIYSTIAGVEQSEGVSRILMNYANPEGIEAGIAGFMVSLFISEAWGNFGIWGLLISPIYVGFIVQFLYVLLLKYKKTPLIIALIVYLILYWPITSLFGKFYYNPEIIIFITIILMVYYIGRQIKRRQYKEFSNYNCNL